MACGSRQDKIVPPYTIVRRRTVSMLMILGSSALLHMITMPSGFDHNTHEKTLIINDLVVKLHHYVAPYIPVRCDSAGASSSIQKTAHPSRKAVKMWCCGKLCGKTPIGIADKIHKYLLFGSEIFHLFCLGEGLTGVQAAAVKQVIHGFDAGYAFV